MYKSIISSIALIILSSFLLTNCQNSDSSFTIQEIDNPSASNSGEAFITVSPDNKLYLSWLEEIDTTKTRLALSHLDGASFKTAKPIATGQDWFINWADFPGIGFIGNTNPVLFAYWLQMSTSGTYDYDINYTLSHDSGNTWKNNKVLHNDGIAAEHGFVSSCTINDRLLAVWLDGRHTKLDQASVDADAHGHEHSDGRAMTLRSAVMNQSGEISQRLEIDAKVCDCCQTDVTGSDCGPIVVYRNRSNDEIRDIYFSILKDTGWITPKAIHPDGWKINGCPVNGPRIAASKNLIAVAWYTESGGFRKTLLNTSSDCGKSFSKPVILSFDSTAMGRIDIQINDDQDIYVSYMEEHKDEAAIWLAKCNSNGQILKKEIIAKNGKSRKSGFPRMAIYDKHIYIAYRDILYTDRIKVLKIS